MIWLCYNRWYGSDAVENERELLRMYYLIRESLTPCSETDLKDAEARFAAVLNSAEWAEKRELFDMGIDLEMDPAQPQETKAEVNVDSLTGSLVRPALVGTGEGKRSFSFALDEKGIVLVDDGGYAEALTDRISRSKRWKMPGLERFLYDLLEEVIAGDLSYLEKTEQRLSLMEEEILQEKVDTYPPELNDIRGDLLDLRVHYEQLIDLGQELQENENGFFREEDLRYFRLFTERVIRLQETVAGQREYVAQLRDLIQTQLDVRQNRIMTLLTVITSIFLPLTVIAGWYGMNFRHMPELDWPWAYPAVIGVSAAIVVICLVWFRRKKWM